MHLWLVEPPLAILTSISHIIVGEFWSALLHSVASLRWACFYTTLLRSHLFCPFSLSFPLIPSLFCFPFLFLTCHFSPFAPTLYDATDTNVNNKRKRKGKRLRREACREPIDLLLAKQMCMPQQAIKTMILLAKTARHKRFIKTNKEKNREYVYIERLVYIF